MLGGIGTFLLAVWKWVFSSIIEERDHFAEENRKKETEIDTLKTENLRLQRNLDEKQILINSFIREHPEWGAFFDGIDNNGGTKNG